MNICIPVLENKGMESAVSAHFGSAPFFMIVDTDSKECRSIPNQSDHSIHGACTPLQSFQGEKLDGLVVGGIGQGAIMKLAAAGIQVFFSEQTTVGETLAAFKAGKLKTVTSQMACGGHSGGCSHD